MGNWIIQSNNSSSSRTDEKAMYKFFFFEVTQGIWDNQNNHIRFRFVTGVK